MNKKNSRSSLKLPKLSSSPSKLMDKNKAKTLRENNSKLTAGAYAIYDFDLQPVIGTRQLIKSSTAAVGERSPV